MTTKEILQYIIDHNGNCQELPEYFCSRCPISNYGKGSCLEIALAYADHHGTVGNIFCNMAQDILTDMAINDILLGDDSENNSIH